MQDNLKAVLLGLAGFALYATHDVIVKYLGASYSPQQILFFGVLFGFPIVSVMLIQDRTEANLRPRHPWWSLLRTVAMIIATLSIFYAFATLPLAQTYSILFSVPLIITLLAIPVLGERVGLHRGAAVLMGLIGVLIVVRPGATEFSLGHAAALIGSFATSLASIIVRRIGKDEREVVLLLMPMIGMFLVMAALMPLDYQPMPILDLGLTGLVALLSLLALNCLIRAYKAGEAAIVAPMQYSQIIWAILFGVFLFDETMDLITLAGTAVIIASGFYIVWRESLREVSSNTPVLRSFGRILPGPNLRFGPFLKLSLRGKKERD